MLSMATRCDAGQAATFMHGLAAQTEGLGRVRKDIAEYMVASTKRTFRAGGRPLPWKPSRRALELQGKTLIKSGRMMRSIRGRVRGETILVGTNVAYAPAHQFGSNKVAQQQVRTHVRRTKLGNFAVVRAHSRRMRQRLPRRRFLAVLREDKRYMNRRILEHLNIRSWR